MKNRSESPAERAPSRAAPVTRHAVGGSWDGVTMTESEIGTHSFDTPGDCAFVRSRCGTLDELYQLGDDDTLHYVLTRSTGSWRYDGDPCTYCGSSETAVVAEAHRGDHTVTLECGLTYVLPASRLTTVRCSHCGMVFVVDLYAPVFPDPRVR